jgi:hypothetical protein
MTGNATSFPLSKVAWSVTPHLHFPAGLFIYSSCGECPFPTRQWSIPHFSHCYNPSLQAHWGTWHHTHLLQPASLLMVHVKECLSTTPVAHATLLLLLQAFPSPRLLGGCCHSCLLWPACLFTVSVRECPFTTLQSSGHPSLFATFFF